MEMGSRAKCLGNNSLAKVISVAAPQHCCYLCPNGHFDLGCSLSESLLSMLGLAFVDGHRGTGGGSHLVWEVLAVGPLRRQVVQRQEELTRLKII